PAIAAIGESLQAGWIVAATRSRGVSAINSIDLLTINLPLAGRWIQDHGLWQLADYFPLQSHGSYPHDGDLLILGSMLPWRSDFVVAGVGLGIAFGTKWYGPTTIAVLLAVWAGASWLAGRRLRWIAATGGALVALTLALGGFLLVRNAIEYWNPVFPATVHLFG